MHDETPSIASATKSVATDARDPSSRGSSGSASKDRHSGSPAVPWIRHVQPKPSADHAISGLRPTTSESAPSSPTPRNVSAWSSASMSPDTRIAAGVVGSVLTAPSLSGLTSPPTTYGRLGIERPSDMKYSQLASSAHQKLGDRPLAAVAFAATSRGFFGFAVNGFAASTAGRTRCSPPSRTTAPAPTGVRSHEAAAAKRRSARVADTLTFIAQPRCLEIDRPPRRRPPPSPSRGVSARRAFSRPPQASTQTP